MQGSQDHRSRSRVWVLTQIGSARFMCLRSISDTGEGHGMNLQRIRDSRSGQGTDWTSDAEGQEHFSLCWAQLWGPRSALGDQQ